MSEAQNCMTGMFWWVAWDQGATPEWIFKLMYMENLSWGSHGAFKIEEINLRYCILEMCFLCIFLNSVIVKKKKNQHLIILKWSKAMIWAKGKRRHCNHVLVGHSAGAAFWLSDRKFSLAQILPHVGIGRTDSFTLSSTHPFTSYQVLALCLVLGSQWGWADRVTALKRPHSSGENGCQ